MLYLLVEPASPKTQVLRVSKGRFPQSKIRVNFALQNIEASVISLLLPSLVLAVDSCFRKTLLFWFLWCTTFLEFIYTPWNFM